MPEYRNVALKKSAAYKFNHIQRQQDNTAARAAPGWIYINAIDERAGAGQAAFERSFIDWLCTRTDQPVFVLPSAARRGMRHFHRVGLNKRSKLGYLTHQWRLYRTLRKIRAAYGPLPLYFRSSGILVAPLLFARRYGLPLTLRLGPGHYDVLFYHRIPRFLHRPLAAYYAWVIRKADRIVVVTDQIRRTLIETYGTAPDKITVLPNPANVTVFQDAVRPHPTAAAHTMGYVGSLHKYQGIDQVLLALGRLAASHRLPDDFQFMLVGDGPDRTRLEQLSARHALQQYVHFIGRVPQSELPQYYHRFRFAVAPYTAAFNSVKGSSALKVAEYLYFDLPVLAADIADYRFLTRHRLGSLYRLDDVDSLAEALADWLIHPPDRVAGRTFVLEHRAPAVIFRAYLKIIS